MAFSATGGFSEGETFPALALFIGLANGAEVLTASSTSPTTTLTMRHHFTHVALIGPIPDIVGDEGKGMALPALRDLGNGSFLHELLGGFFAFATDIEVADLASPTMHTTQVELAALIADVFDAWVGLRHKVHLVSFLTSRLFVFVSLFFWYALRRLFLLSHNRLCR